jgi:superfamily I DNA and/or RNA helicase
MPWVQNTLNMKVGEEQPRYTNGLELLAVESVLKLLTVPSGQAKKPTLAILSPYSRQVARINNIVEHEESVKATLSRFARAAKQKTFCSTVDSFQGSEADCIVISLVRNNNLATVSSALGFLSDSRRMNVLMSRARWKLVIIGSLDFLDSVLKCPKPAGDAIKIEFLEKLISDLNRTTDNENVRIVPFNKLKTSAQ